MAEIMVPIQISDVLDDLDDEDLLSELRSRGVLALKASERLENLLSDMERTWKDRDEAHFRVLMQWLRDLVE